MEWKKQTGNHAARDLLQAYPTPRALREAIRENGTGIFPDAVRSIPVFNNVTLGELITSVWFVSRDVVAIHAALGKASRDIETWTAPDGSVTIR